MQPEKSEQNSPSLSIENQYIKDLSFENPNATSILGNIPEKPKMEISLKVDVVHLQTLEANESYEVSIYIQIKTSVASKVMFALELVYAAICTVRNISEEQKKIVLYIQCPNLMFPFLRHIVSNTTQVAGFQPLMLEPIDFGALYLKNLNNTSS